MRRKRKELIFGTLMATFMVYGMEVYNATLRQGTLTLDLLLPPWQALFLVPIVVLVQTFYGGPLAGRLYGALVKNGLPSESGQILLRQFCTVLFMCPAMSLVAVFVFKGGLQAEFLTVWLNTVKVNAPMALIWQIAVAGPAVRTLVQVLSEMLNKMPVKA